MTLIVQAFCMLLDLARTLYRLARITVKLQFFLKGYKELEKPRNLRPTTFVTFLRKKTV